MGTLTWAMSRSQPGAGAMKAFSSNNLWPMPSSKACSQSMSTSSIQVVHPEFSRSPLVRAGALPALCHLIHLAAGIDSEHPLQNLAHFRGCPGFRKNGFKAVLAEFGYDRCVRVATGYDQL